MANALLSIGDFAALTRLSVKALRHYDEHGLLSPAHVDPINKYRFYSHEQVERATLIGDLRRVEVPLPVVAQMVDATAEEALEVFGQWWAAQERRHADRRGIGRYITARLRQERQIPMEIHTRQVPARKLAVISAELFQPQLDAFMTDAFEELFSWASRHPGLRSPGTTPDEPTYAVFHGPITPDQSNRLDVCMVIDGPVEPEGRISLMVEEAHPEAYVEVTRNGLEFPAILEAYDAVGAWVGERRAVRAGWSPREVYITDVLAAAPDDVVCSVAYPLADGAAEAGS